MDILQLTHSLPSPQGREVLPPGWALSLGQGAQEEIVNLHLSG